MKQTQPPASASEREALPTQVDVKIHALYASGSVLADASVDLNGCFAIRGVKVVQGTSGPFVSMPSYKGKGGYKEVCFPCTKEFRQQFHQAVLDAYQQALNQLPQRQQDMGDGAPAANQRSVCGGERRSSEMSEPCRMRQGEGYGACDDAAPPAPEMKM